jgi:hypothetical protein
VNDDTKTNGIHFFGLGVRIPTLWLENERPTEIQNGVHAFKESNEAGITVMEVNPFGQGETTGDYYHKLQSFLQMEGKRNDDVITLRILRDLFVQPVRSPKCYVMRK